MTVADPGLGPGAEFDRIRALLAGARPPPPGVRVGPGDDALVLESGGAGGAYHLLSTDLMMEGVHFRREWIGAGEAVRRAVGGALSDLAAMAAEPVGFLVSLAVPRGPEGDALFDDLRGGLDAAGQELGVALLGGDLTASSGPLVLDVVAAGRADRPVLRRGGEPGDELWVTGRLGGSAAAVRAWESGATPAAELRDRFARPRPRVEEARWLQARGVMAAAIDLSDGLAGDAAHLAVAGGLVLTVEEAALPVEPGAVAATSVAEATELALHGGEDYELCFLARPGTVPPLQEAFEERFGLPLTRVGRAESPPPDPGRSGVRLRPADGGATVLLEAGGFDHFRAREAG